MDKFSSARIESPFVLVEQLELGGDFALVNDSRGSRTDKQLELKFGGELTRQTRETENEFMMKVLNPVPEPEHDFGPIPNPLDNSEAFRTFPLPHDIQQIALITGGCPVVFSSVKSSTDPFHRLLWSDKHSFLVQMIISFLVRLSTS